MLGMNRHLELQVGLELIFEFNFTQMIVIVSLLLFEYVFCGKQL